MALETEYWLKWQVGVCALILVVPCAVSTLVIFRRRKEEEQEALKASDFWLPCWTNLNPRYLLFYRLFAFFSLASMLSIVVIHHGFFAFYFYTQWTFLLVTIYFAIGTVISARGCWTYSKYNSQNEEGQSLKKDTKANPLTKKNSITKMDIPFKLRRHHEHGFIEQRAGFWEHLMQIIYQTSAGAALLTDIVFWCLLVPFLSGKHFKMTLLIAGMHSLNAAFLLIDTSLNRMPFPWFRLAYFVFWSCLYVIFQWVLHACGFTWWPYPFLELTTPLAPLWYLSLALVHIPCYALYALIVNVKSRAFSKLFPSYSTSC